MPETTRGIDIPSENEPIISGADVAGVIRALGLSADTAIGSAIGAAVTEAVEEANTYTDTATASARTYAQQQANAARAGALAQANAYTDDAVQALAGLDPQVVADFQDVLADYQAGQDATDLGVDTAVQDSGPTGRALLGRPEVGGQEATHLWEPPTQPAGSTLVSWSGQDFLDLYEAMRADDPAYVTRAQIGQDAEDNPIWAYHFTPTGYENTVLIFNQHGAEKVSILTVATFMDLVVNHWQDHPRLAALRARTRIIVVPFVSWHSVAMNSRKNANGVDLNRNWNWKWDEFPSAPEDTTYKGTAPFSEPETQALRDLALDLRDTGGLTMALDVHDTGEEQKPDPYHIYMGMPDRDLEPQNWVRHVVNMLTTDDHKRTMGNSTVPKAPSWLTANGIRSVTVEYEQSWGSVGLDSANQTAALRIFGNIILAGATRQRSSNAIEEGFTRTFDFVAGTSNIQVAQAASGFGSEIQEFRYEFTPPCAGYVIVSGEITLGATTGRQFVTPVAGQLGTNWGPDTPQASEQRYCDLADPADRITLPFGIARPVIENPEFPFRYSLFVRSATAPGAFVYRYQARLEFVPSVAPARFERWAATGRGGTGLGALQRSAGI